MKLQLAFGLLACVMVSVTAAACGASAHSTFETTEDASANATDPGDASGPGVFGNDDASASPPSSTCKPLTCADLGNNCGPAGDGCGGTIASCGTCTAPETCGGGGKPSQCGGSAACIPTTCAALGSNCGAAGDGCGGTIASCGTCTGTAFCGGGGPSKCGDGDVTEGGAPIVDGGVCVPRTTCNPNECGPVADGCGGLLSCLTSCPSPETCGGGGVASMCGAPACTKTTCAAQGANCGYIADGCGGILDCGGSMPGAGCTTGFCGGGGVNKCGAGTVDSGTCVNFCPSQATCTPTTLTTITGTVFAPNGTLPLPGAVVYVPNGSMTYPYGVSTFTDGVSGGTCDSCSATASGSPLVSTTSNYDGTFTLTNVPAGVSFPLVIQLGRWRRLVMVPAITKCTSVAEPAALTSFPSTQHEGGVADNIPLFALSTGYIDGLECVFRKLGVNDNQFGDPGGSARIQFYLDDEENGLEGAYYSNKTPSVSSLIATQAQMEKYDALLFACPGGETDKATAPRGYLENYAGEGGRVFTTHFNYSWLINVADDLLCGGPAGSCDYTSNWATTANWYPEDPAYTEGATDTGLVSTTASGGIFDQWLNAPGVKALSATTPDRVSITEPRYDVFTPVAAGAEEFISQYKGATPTPVFHYAFNTPFNGATQCGRVIFSAFHVTSTTDLGTDGSYDYKFPNECDSTALSAQEKILAYMLFNLTSCIPPVTPPPPPTCTKIGCGAQTCGPASDGCGGTQSCGVCPAGEICEGTPSKCITPTCTKAVCKTGECGTVSDGCGGTLACGSCATGMVCGGGGANTCGVNTCTALTCTQQGISCGPAGNGCGTLIQCGNCPGGMTCGGGGTPGQCGAPTCTPRTCAAADANCGPIADGCGGSINCGTCAAAGQTCGGGGTPNQCGGTGPVN